MSPWQIEKVMNDPTVHNWVKDTIQVIDDKDPVDVLHGLDLLKRLIEQKI